MKKELMRQKRIHGLGEEVTSEEEKLLLGGMPVQKIIGFINFDDLKINVGKNVLIPRYETQEVVYEALKHIKQNSRVLDLCCGSGYIGLTVKHKRNCEVVLSDIDDEAIAQTMENALLNDLDVKVIKSDLFENIEGFFDVIVSNPPYIPSNTQLSDSVTLFEPSRALFGGKDGNDFYKAIIAKASKFLRSNGYLIFEISPDNVAYLSSQGFEIIRDINSKERIAIKQFLDI